MSDRKSFREYYEEKVSERYCMVARGSGKSFSTLIDNISRFVVAMWEFMYNHYPNRRVVHLARYGKRARTRKKNRNRILRYFRNSD